MNPSPTEPPSSFWRRRVLAPVLAQLRQGASPHGLALTSGVGLACGVFPFLGFTTGLCFIAAWTLRLNQPVIHVINQLLWPVQLALIAVYVRAGAWLFGTEAMPFDVAEVRRVFGESQAEFWSRFGLMGLHAFTAWLLTVPVIVGLAYWLLRPILARLASGGAARA